MFEAFCALLLRLYPAEFRRAYGREAVQLMKSRAQHERGVLLRIRLLMDLVIDLCATSGHGWQPAKPLLPIAARTPRFGIIDVHGPGPKAFAAGTLASFLIWLATLTLSFQPKTIPNVLANIGTKGRAVRSLALPAMTTAPHAVTKDPESQHDLIAAIAGKLKELYVDRGLGRQLSDGLLTHEKNGDYITSDVGSDLAARINRDIQITAHGLGIPSGIFVADVVYSDRPLPSGPAPPMTNEMRERNRATLLEQNCLFEIVDTLPHNVGYIKLNGFADVTLCKETAVRVMTSLNNASALIIDLRDNGGGFGDTALQIAGYLFDRPTYMYDPRPNSPVPTHTASPIPGNKLVDKPAYILTSSSTQSAAEYFVYNLKMLKRAVVVGETTAGHQHSGGFYRINDHFGMGIQDAAPPRNPYTVKGWEIIGIEPDVKVSRHEALDVAKKLAESRR
jgi:hypothetical protein